MEVQELGHLVLYVHDIERSAAFYRDVLGWRQIGGWGVDGSHLASAPIAAFSAPNGRTHHELLLIEVGPDAAEQPAGRRVGLYHFGLKIGDDPVKQYAYRTCNNVGCIAVGEVDSNLEGALRGAEDAKLQFAGLDGKQVELPLSLKGYKAARRAYKSDESKRASWFWRLWS